MSTAIMPDNLTVKENTTRQMIHSENKTAEFIQDHDRTDPLLECLRNVVQSAPTRVLIRRYPHLV